MISTLSEAEAHRLVDDVRKSQPDFHGRHMLNFKVETSQGWAILRIPRPEFIGYDARMLAEGDAIRMAEFAGANVPKILYQADEFLVESFIEGGPARNSEWRQWLDDLLAQVSTVRCANLGSSYGIRTIYEWQCWMRGFLLDLHARLYAEYAGRIDAVGLPSLGAVWTPDPSEDGAVSLVHADLHAENLVIGPNGTLWILDWELAVIADPVWEAAVSVHRTKWPDETARSTATDLWLESLREVGDEVQVARRYEIYRTLEIWKSLLVDSVKYPNDIRDDRAMLDARTDSFHRKLIAGRDLFGCSDLSRDEVRALLSEWTMT